jgi:hypothetical protein
VTYFLSFVEDRYKYKDYHIHTHIHTCIYVHILYMHYISNVSKSGTVRGPLREEEKKKKSYRVNNTETHYICVGIRHNETH